MIGVLGETRFLLFNFEISEGGGGVNNITRNVQHLPSHRHHALTHAQRWTPRSAPPSKHVCNLLLDMKGESIEARE